MDSTLVLQKLLRCGKLQGLSDPGRFAHEPLRFFPDDPTIPTSSSRSSRAKWAQVSSAPRLASDSSHECERRLRDEMILYGLHPRGKAHPRVSSGSRVLDVVETCDRGITLGILVVDGSCDG